MKARASQCGALLRDAPLTVALALTTLVLAAWSALGGDTSVLVLADGAGWWTPLTGPLLHLSATHLALDLLAIVLIGLVFEPRLGWRYGLAYLAITAAVAASFARGYQHLDAYYGLSSHAHGLLAAGLLGGALRCPRRTAIILALLAAKCLLEALDPLRQFGLSRRDVDLYGQPVPWVHIAGVLAGGISICWTAGYRVPWPANP